MSSARARSLDELASTSWDVLVVGAGIIGSRVAYEAALSGLRVALVDAGDFGGATSSASSKFVHGGLRYMSSWQIRLVRSSQREREALCRIAPHLVSRRPLVLAEHAGYPLPVYAAGLALYKAVAGAGTPRPRIVSVRRGLELAPFLLVGGLKTCTLLPEAQTNDARLTLATVRAAVGAGACVASYVRVLELERVGSVIRAALLESVTDGARFPVRARAVVNATGPWVDEVRALEDPARAPLVRLSKGTHLVLQLDGEWKTGVASSRDGTRTTFAVPYDGTLLVGVTDTPYEGAPGEVAPTREDVYDLLEDASYCVAPELLGAERVLHAFAGLRVLPLGEGTTRDLPREHVVATGPAGMISVAGGKLTTHRLIAIAALRRLPSELRPKRMRPSDEPLPGAGAPPEGLSELDPEIAEHLVGLYGSDAATVLAYGDGELERIDPTGPDVWAQVSFAVEHEWALTADDVVRRRTTLALRGLDTPATRAGIAARIAGRPQQLLATAKRR
jgi:glycerol-3-phosphate dehydrogenase